MPFLLESAPLGEPAFMVFFQRAAFLSSPKAHQIPRGIIAIAEHQVVPQNSVRHSDDKGNDPAPTGNEVKLALAAKQTNQRQEIQRKKNKNTSHNQRIVLPRLRKSQMKQRPHRSRPTT